MPWPAHPQPAPDWAPPPTSTSTRLLAMLLCLASLVTLLGACATPGRTTRDLLTPYRISVPQGNYLDEAMLGQIKPGMSPEQVQFALGTPLFKDPFRPEEWNYIFRFQHASGKVDLRRSTLYFANGQLSRVQTDALPSPAQEPDPALPSPTRRSGRNR